MPEVRNLIFEIYQELKSIILITRIQITTQGEDGGQEMLEMLL